MKRNWWSVSLRVLPALCAALAVSAPGFALDYFRPIHPFQYVDAPEVDPALAIVGLAAAGTAAALIWEKVRRRR